MVCHGCKVYCVLPRIVVTSQALTLSPLNFIRFYTYPRPGKLILATCICMVFIGAVAVVLPLMLFSDSYSATVLIVFTFIYVIVKC